MMRDVFVVIRRQCCVQSFHEKILLPIFQRRNQRITFLVLTAEYDFLPDSRLDILIHIRPGKAKHQPVGPGFINYSYFSHYCFVVVFIVEPTDMLNFLFIDGTGFEVFYGSIYPIIVIRIILKSIDRISQTILEGLPEVDV